MLLKAQREPVQSFKYSSKDEKNLERAKFLLLLNLFILNLELSITLNTENQQTLTKKS
ncbi:MAG: hypothetical protein ACI9LM_004755 [Alteromonadaceae bacterium]|jgi:hypothetical protein